MKQRKRIFGLLFIYLVLFAVTNAFSEESGASQIMRLSDIAGKTVALQTGTCYDVLLNDHEALGGTLTFDYYNTLTDMIHALRTGKADAVPMDRIIAGFYCGRYPELMVLPEELLTFQCGIGFQKGSPYLSDFNRALAELKQSGKLDELEKKWTDSGAGKTPIRQDWEGVNGTLRYWVDNAYEPMSYVGKGGELLGYDVDVTLHAAQLMGVRMEITPCNFDGLIPALISGKADLISSGITITPERKESIAFSDPYYTGSVMVVVMNPDYHEDTSVGRLWNSIRESFNRTFVREERWRLFAEGVFKTLLITVSAALLGTLLGFAVYLLCQSSAPFVSTCFETVFSLLERMPVIVFLMVLYYIVFGNAHLSGAVVSVIAFTFTFSASMYGILKTGVKAVGNAQRESAYALGYTRSRAFFRVILPQAAGIILPSYRSELISLVKGTAVVGYIAVQDLTKMSDIVRSRTYEAFFPLITTAVIYVILTWILTLLIHRIEIGIEPKKRSKKKILKGVIEK